MYELAKFKSFCLESYKAAHGMKGSEAFEVFQNHGVLDYLGKCFDVIHTQGWQWIVDDIDEFINEKPS